MEIETSKEDGYVLDKIRGGGEHFRVTKAVRKQRSENFLGERDEQKLLPCWVCAVSGCWPSERMWTLVDLSSWIELVPVV